MVLRVMVGRGVGMRHGRNHNAEEVHLMVHISDFTDFQHLFDSQFSFSSSIR